MRQHFIKRNFTIKRIHNKLINFTKAKYYKSVVSSTSHYIKNNLYLQLPSFWENIIDHQMTNFSLFTEYKKKFDS